MTFSWFKEVEKKKTKYPSYKRRMTNEELSSSVLELRKKGYTHRDVMRALRIGMPTLYRVLKENNIFVKKDRVESLNTSVKSIEERVSVLEMQLEIVINKLKEIYEGNTKN